MPAKIISQRKFAKLVSTTGPLAQPAGSLPRLSNLLYTQRGSLQISDGSLAIATAISNSLIATIASFANLQLGQYPYYLALAYPTTPVLSNVTGFVASPIPGAGNPAGTYTFAITATLGAGQTAAVTAGFTTGSTFSEVSFSWSAVAGATGYKIYYVIPGTFPTYVLLSAVGATTGFTWPGPLPTSPAVTPTPTTNTTYDIQLYVGSPVASGPSYVINFVAVTAAVFPFTISPPPVGYTLPVPYPATIAPGSPSFALQTVPGFSPYGGITGAVGPLPQIVQFAGKSILILGNGYAPQSLDPSQGASATVTPLANTFTAAYPTWQPAITWTTGSQVTDGAGHYFTATQGGVSQTPGPPSWNTSQGAETADGSVIWTSNGPIVGSEAPRGAAHAVDYAGSLWLANTYPFTTSDQIDGPSCLKMSDSNNPNSWNPVNTAFIGRDDGTQITGLQPFTIAALGISPTGSLCVFKEFTTYQVIGVFGSATFEIQPAQTNLGCIAPRSIQFIPGFGIVRFTHLGFAVFDGINDRLISEDIRPYLFGGVDSEADLSPVDPRYAYVAQSAQTIEPPMYYCAMPIKPTGSGVAGLLTRLFCYDLVMKSWAVLDLPWTITSLTTLSVGDGYPIVVVGKSDGTIQRIQSGDTTWDTGASDQSSVNWSFRSPDVFGEGATQRLFYEQVTMTGYGSTAMIQSIVAKLWIDGTNIGAQGLDIVPTGDSTFTVRVSIFRSGYRAHLDISGNNGGSPGTIDSLDWAVTPKSAMARRVIS